MAWDCPKDLISIQLKHLVCLVKNLVEDQLLGNLKVVSDKGTTFNVEFEMAKE
ncbi:hypothetical protein C5S31_10345 [ANME-1 cluster archaeon GoMg2]|nr:hypothetical protein [ANME-1 cluster archaeon GoMg2]